MGVSVTFVDYPHSRYLDDLIGSLAVVNCSLVLVFGSMEDIIGSLALANGCLEDLGMRIK